MKNYKRILEYIIRRFKGWNLKLYRDTSSYLNVIHVHATTLNIGDEILSDAIRLIFQDDNLKFIHYTNAYKKTSKGDDEYINNPFQLIGAIKNCDAVVIGGGDVILGNLNRYLYLIIISKLCHIPVFLIGIGVNFRNAKKINLIITRYALMSCERILVREKDSYQRLVKLGIARDKIEILVDLAFLLDDDKYNGRKLEGYPSPYIVVSLRSPEFNSLYWGNEQYMKIASALDKIIYKYGYYIVFLPMFIKKEGYKIFYRGEDVIYDDQIYDIIRNFMKNKRLAAVDYVIKNYSDAAEMIRNAEMCISMRLHSMILSTIVSTPFISISYNLKTDAYIKSINMEEFSVDADCVDTDEIVKLVSKLKERRNEIQNKLNIIGNQAKIKARGYLSLKKMLKRRNKTIFIRFNNFFLSNIFLVSLILVKLFKKIRILFKKWETNKL